MPHLSAYHAALVGCPEAGIAQVLVPTDAATLGEAHVVALERLGYELDPGENPEDLVELNKLWTIDEEKILISFASGDCRAPTVAERSMAEALLRE